ncbi:hypothetical protein EXIGLDRAFT_833179 [Exidia glandulosa HHB12029]|uniref:Uncharacterized protein n=1 Tax=Exidia glandulosa HHB12029 TaxID=1314781 RepID=A0A165KXR1_EXIGL|nr:hypothetical protein EXIGLDRAFT_833179 [Exidia glandulosa HHB12029]
MPAIDSAMPKPHANSCARRAAHEEVARAPDGVLFFGFAAARNLARPRCRRVRAAITAATLRARLGEYGGPVDFQRRARVHERRHPRKPGPVARARAQPKPRFGRDETRCAWSRFPSRRALAVVVTPNCATRCCVGSVRAHTARPARCARVSGSKTTRCLRA